MLRKLLIAIHRVTSPFISDKVDRTLHFDKEGEDAQNLIYDLLTGDKPVMICRFGSTELTAIEGYLCRINLKNIMLYLSRRIERIGYANYIVRNMWQLSGFFPSHKRNLNRFALLMLSLLPSVDVLGSWRQEENLLRHNLTNAVKIPLYCLEPYYFENPWTRALEGKRVLVIHPFEDTIKKQHAILDKLFENQKLAPRYELLTIKAVQSIAGNKPDGFSDWFQALDWMKSEIDKRDFDIAIIGCGAYGFPLAAYVKHKGKKAIHLGGAVQYLFGIRSRAADKDGEIIKPNEYWVRPSQSEIPNNIEVVENARYW